MFHLGTRVPSIGPDLEGWETAYIVSNANAVSFFPRISYLLHNFLHPTFLALSECVLEFTSRYVCHESYEIE
jgi:hypothetical protein